MFSQIKDRKHIEQNFHSVARVMRQGFDLRVLGGVKNFSMGICDGALSTVRSSLFCFGSVYIVRKKANSRNRYNRAPHLTQDTTWEKCQKHYKTSSTREPRGHTFPDIHGNDNVPNISKHHQIINKIPTCMCILIERNKTVG